MQDWMLIAHIHNNDVCVGFSSSVKGILQAAVMALPRAVICAYKTRPLSEWMGTESELHFEWSTGHKNCMYRMTGVMCNKNNEMVSWLSPKIRFKTHFPHRLHFYWSCAWFHCTSFFYSSIQRGATWRWYVSHNSLLWHYRLFYSKHFAATLAKTVRLVSISRLSSSF